MPFTLFDINTVSAVKFKFQSFNLNAYQALCEANEFDQRRNVYTLGLSGKTMDEHRKSLIKNIHKSNPKGFKLHLQQYQTDNLLLKEQSAYEIMQKTLNQLQWEANKSQEIRHEQILKLKKFWDKNKTTSHDTSESIYISANVILPLFQNFLLLAQEELEFRKKKIPKKVLLDLQNYITRLELEINDRKNQICNAMISRLQVAAEEKNLENDDVTHYILKQLKSNGIDFNFPVKRKNGLTPQFFCYFHQFICRHGDSQQIRKLKKLNWFLEDEHYTSQEIDSEWTIIPKFMQKFGIPTKTKSFPFLFSEQNWRINFLKTHFYYLSQTRSLDNLHCFKSMDLVNMIKAEEWKKLLQLEYEVKEQQLKASHYQQSFFRRIFFPKRVQFYKEWGLENCHYLQKIIKAKIQYALQLSKQLETRVIFDLDSVIMYNEQTQNFLRSLIQNIDESSKFIANYSEWQNCKKILLSAVRSQSKPSTTKTILAKIQDKTCSENAKQMVGIFNSISKGDEFDFELPNFSQDLLELEKILKADQTQQEAPNLQKFWMTFFSCYLKSILNLKNHENLELVRNFLLTVSPSYIKERVIVLNEDRKKRSPFMYETRCRAMLFICSQFSASTLCDASADAHIKLQ